MEYPALNTYLKANPSSTVDQLFAIEDAIRYAKQVKGTTLDDIYNAKQTGALCYSACIGNCCIYIQLKGNVTQMMK